LWVGFPVAYPFYFGVGYGYGSPYYYGGYGYPYPPYNYGYPYPNPSPYSYSYPPAPPAPAAPPLPSAPSSPSSGYPGYRQPVYPAATSASIEVLPGQAQANEVLPRHDQANIGGASFEITPATAEIYVDGSLVGRAADFTPTTQPLDLAPGRHRIEIRAPGYRTVAVDADIVAGQVIPYQGVLEP